MQKTSGASRLNAQLKTARNEFVSCVTTMKLAKGDHRHIGSAETRYKFADPETLLADFWNDVEAWRISVDVITLQRRSITEQVSIVLTDNSILSS
jgi:hypothetical protein